MVLSALLGLAGVNMLAVMSPGPDSFMVMHTAARSSRKEAFFCALGISLGVAVWTASSLLGLQWLFEQFEWLHKIVVVLGGIYLLWMGIKLLGSAFSRGHSEAQTQAAPVDGGRKAFVCGLLTNLSNAKALIYFTSVFAVFVSSDIDLATGAVITVIFMLEALLWFTLMGLLFGSAGAKKLYGRAGKWIDGLCGGVFSGVGSTLLFSSFN